MLRLSIRAVKQLEYPALLSSRPLQWWADVLPSRRDAGPVMLKFLNSLLSLTLICALALCAMPMLAFWGRSVHWALDLVSHFVLPSIIAACGLSILAGLLGRTWTGAGALAIAITASLSVSGFTTPPRPSEDVQQTFKVLLFNVWYRNADAARLVDTVRRSDADIIVLLEAVPDLRRKLSVLGDIYPHRLACPDTDPCDILVLSRVALEGDGVRRTDDRFRSPVLSFRAQLAPCPLSLHAVHLVRPFPFTEPMSQLRQAQDVSALFAGGKASQLVLGDFNAAPWSEAMRAVVAPGKLSLLSGAGGTWPASLPRQMRIPIDHFAAGPGLRFLKREVLPAAGSDHAPVLATVGVSRTVTCPAA